MLEAVFTVTVLVERHSPYQCHRFQGPAMSTSLLTTASAADPRPFSSLLHERAHTGIFQLCRTEEDNRSL